MLIAMSPRSFAPFDVSSSAAGRKATGHDSACSLVCPQMAFNKIGIVRGVVTDYIWPAPSERNSRWVAFKQVPLQKGAAEVRQAGLPEKMRRIHESALDNVMEHSFQKFFLCARQV